MRRAGTSLIELMISLVVLSIFAAAMTLLITSNSRADENTDARREARGVARSAINMLESEIRTGEPAGVISADDSTFTFRQPFAFGVVCDTLSGNVTIATLPSADLPGSLLVTGYTGWAYRDSTGSYHYQSSTTIASGTAATCTGQGITPLTASSGRVVQVPKVSGPQPGSVAFLYRQITYSLRASAALSGRRGLFRTPGAGGTAVEFATPFASTARFRWYLLHATEAVDTLPTSFADLSGIQFVLPAQSTYTPRTASGPMQAPFTTSIFFQNRPN